MLMNQPHPAFSIRQAVEADAERICEVLTRSVREVCAKDYDYNEEILNSWCGNKNPARIREWILNPDNFFLVLENGTRQIVGVALYGRRESVVQLCYLLPEAIGKGNGTRLLKALEAEAKRTGQGEISLNSTITGRPFYLREGFEPNGDPTYHRKTLVYPMRKKV
jgi:GNAT superfamily N-acetyltransferase